MKYKQILRHVSADGGSWGVLDAISDGRDRILPALTTGTGKTFIAFQLAWKLFHSKWNLRDWKHEGQPTRRPKGGLPSPYFGGYPAAAP